MSKLSIIVPVYWNSDTLMLLYEDMKEKILHKLEDYEIVFVDDGSGDNSWEIMNQIRDMDDKVRLVKLSRNFGEHSAILAGLSVCTGDCAVTKQADLQEDSELILQLYEKWKEGNKVVLAVRADRDEGAIQKFFANLYYTITRKLIMKNMPKGGFDCYLLDRQVIEVLLMLDEKNSALTLQVLWVGFKTEKVYFHRKAREIGESRWTLSKKIKLVVDSMMSFSYFPVRCMAGLAVFYLSAGFFVIFFTSSFMRLSVRMKCPRLWAGLGRAVNNICAFGTGSLSLLLLKSGSPVVKDSTLLVLLVLISILFFLYSGAIRPGERKKEAGEKKSVQRSEEERLRIFADSFSLTEREREVLKVLLVSDENVQDIAEELMISRAALYRHLTSLNEKTGTKSRIGLVQFYYRYDKEIRNEKERED